MVVDIPCSDEPDKRTQLLVDGVNVLRCTCPKDTYSQITDTITVPIKDDAATVRYRPSSPSADFPALFFLLPIYN